MSIEEESDCVVIFTPEEMESFNEDFELQLSNAELELRKGEELHSVQVLSYNDNDSPLDAQEEHYLDYDVFADLKNPIALIIDGATEQCFRIRRPKNYDLVVDTLQNRLAEERERRLTLDDWAEDDSKNEF